MTTWNYIIGNEKDFEGAPDWALYRAQVKINGNLLDAWEGRDNRYCYTLESEGPDAKMEECNDGGFINWGWSTRPTIVAQREPITDAAPAVTNDSKYNRPCKGITVDVYDVLKAFNVTCPALQHLIKKALAVGQRGHKDASEDLKDILASAKRAIELSEGE